MGRKPIKAKAMTNAERQRRHYHKAAQCQAQANHGRQAGQTGGEAGLGRDRCQRCGERWAPGDSGLFTVIYADPPWRFEPHSCYTGHDRAPDRHYDTMTLADINAMQFAAPDQCYSCGRSLRCCHRRSRSWPPGVHLCVPLRLDQTEDRPGILDARPARVLLIGKRGAIPAPAPGEQLSSAFVEPKNTPFDGHSRKPAYFAEIIKRQFPGVAKLELFSRSPRPGWAAHGDQLPLTGGFSQPQ